MTVAEIREKVELWYNMEAAGMLSNQQIHIKEDGIYALHTLLLGIEKLAEKVEEAIRVCPAICASDTYALCAVVCRNESRKRSRRCWGEWSVLPDA